MKRILFLSMALCFTYNSVKAQLFTQDFSSSTTVADYVSATPNSGQFNAISPTAGNLTTTITDGALRFNRTASAGIYAFRNYTFSVKPTFVQFKMDFDASTATVSNQNPANPAFTVFIGPSFSTALTGLTVPFVSRCGIYIQNAAGDFKIGSVDGGTFIDTFSGKQTITIVVNSSGADQTYTAPDASTESIANGKMDIWVGTTRGINEFNLKNNLTTDISAFKFQAQGSTSAYGTFNLDNIEFKDLLGSVVLSTSKFENSFSNLKVYPNPTEGIFEINNLPLSLETINLGLYSVDSKLLDSKTYNVNNGTVKLDISGLSKGVYFVKGDANHSLVAKVIKK
jgi:Secretion system C-terminal sorting domain